MGFGTRQQKDFNNVVDRYGTYITHYSGSVTIGSYYSDETLTMTEVGSFKVLFSPSASQDLTPKDWGELIEGNYNVYTKSGNSVEISDWLIINAGSYKVVKIDDWENDNVLIYRKFFLNKVSET